MHIKKQKEATYNDIFNRAVKILSIREHSVLELQQKLKQKFEEKELIQNVIEECKKRSYVNDARFAEIYIKHLIQRGKGSFFIEQELKKKGIDQDNIEQKIEEANIDDEQTALRMAEKKIATLKKLPKEQQKKRLSQYLINRGFSFNTVIKILEEFSL